MRFKEPCPGVQQNSIQMSQDFPRYKDATFLAMRTDILTFPRWKKTCTGAGQPSTGRKQVGTGEEEEEEDVYISDYRVWTETGKGEEQICKEKSVSELSVGV